MVFPKLDLTFPSQMLIAIDNILTSTNVNNVLNNTVSIIDK